MDLRHAVDRMAGHDAEVGHVDALLLTLFNDGHSPAAVHIARKLGADLGRGEGGEGEEGGGEDGIEGE